MSIQATDGVRVITVESGDQTVNVIRAIEAAADAEVAAASASASEVAAAASEAAATAAATNLDLYLPKAGGTMTGGITIDSVAPAYYRVDVDPGNARGLAINPDGDVPKPAVVVDQAGVFQVGHQLFANHNLRGDWTLGDVALLNRDENDARYAARYDTRAAFVADNVGAQVGTVIAGALTYVRDALGTAVTTADGAKWSPAGKVHPEHFGIENASATAQNAKVEAMMAWIASQSPDDPADEGPIPVCDFAGYEIAIDNEIEFDMNRRSVFANGVFKALPSANWNTSNYMGRFTNAYAEFTHLFFDCSNEAYNGIIATGGRSRINVNTEKMKGTGIGVSVPTSSGPEIWLDNCLSGQWNVGYDAEFTDNAEYTATAYKIDKTDTKMVNCTGRWAKRMLDVTDLNGPLHLYGCHFYNGGAGVIQRTDPEGIVGLNNAAAELFLHGVYLDNCLHKFYGDRVNILGGTIILDGADVATTGTPRVFTFYASGASHPRCIIEPYIVQMAGGASFIDFVNYGGDTWTLNYANIEADMDALIASGSQRANFRISPVQTDYQLFAYSDREHRFVGSGSFCRIAMIDNGTTGSGPYVGSDGDNLMLGAKGQKAVFTENGIFRMPALDAEPTANNGDIARSDGTASTNSFGGAGAGMYEKIAGTWQKL